MIPCLPDPETSDPLFRVVIHSHLGKTKITSAYDFLGIPPKQFISDAKEWNVHFPSNAAKRAEFMETYPQNPESFWQKQSDLEYFWIPSRIRLDDSIYQIKQKIVFALGSIRGLTNLVTPNQIELWIDIPTGATWGIDEKKMKALRLGDRFEGFEGDVSWPKQQIDKQNFLTQQGRPRTDLTPLDENDRLLQDFLSEISKPLETPIIHVHLLTDAWDAWVQKEQGASEEALYAYFQKYWPFGEAPPTIFTTKEEFVQYQVYVNYDNQLFKQLSEIPLEPELAPAGCLIEKTEFIVNSQLTGDRVDLLKFFHSIELDMNTVFKRYRDPDQIHPSIVVYEPAVKQKRISPKRLRDWLDLQITQDTRLRESRVPIQTLTIKRFIYDGIDGPRYATIHFTTDGQYTIDFQYKGMEQGGATPAEVAQNLYQIREWVQSAQSMIDIRARRSPNLPKDQAIPLPEFTFHDKTAEFTWGTNMNMISLTLLLAAPSVKPWLTQPTGYEKEFKQQVEHFPLMIIPDLRATMRSLEGNTPRPGEVVYRYTRIPNYSRMNDRFVTIQETILTSPSLERSSLIQEILYHLSKQHQITPEEALQTYQEWDERYGFTLIGQPQRLLRQTGLITRFSTRKLELNGSRVAGFWLGHRALSLLFRIWIQFAKKIPFIADFKRAFDALSGNLDALMEEEDAELRTQTALGVGTAASMFYQANNADLEKFSSIIDEGPSAELLQQFLTDSEQLERDYQAASVAANQNTNEEERGLYPPEGYLTNPEEYPSSFKDIKLDVMCPTQQDIDSTTDTCKDFCDDSAYTLRRLQQFDKELFVVDKKKLGVKHTYSQSCQRSTMQPIVTYYNPETNPNVDRSSFSYAVRYGSSETRQNYYWCPQVWCPYEQISIPYDLVKDKLIHRVTKSKKKCLSALCPSCKEKFNKENWLKVIPEDEFHPYPGFIDQTKHPNNLCMICCYKKSSLDPQYSLYKRYKKCLGETGNTNEEKESRDYIMSREKIPLPADRFGQLTQQLSNLLNSECTTSYLKSGDYCILRRGIAKTAGQPFLETLHYLDNIKDRTEPEWISTSSSVQKKSKTQAASTSTRPPEYITNDENENQNENENTQSGGVKKKVNKITTVTPFMPYQDWIQKWTKNIPRNVFPTLSRGQLVRYFRPDPIPSEWATLSDSELRKKVEDAAYDNFIDFLMNPTEKVPIELLWDWLQRPGTLYKDGVNIFIFRGNEILCPYAEDIDDLYKSGRPSLFLLTNLDQTMYEPIVYLINRKGKFYVTPFFSSDDDNVKRILQHLRKSCQSKDPVSWERVRQGYSPHVTLSKNKAPLPTYHERLEQIPEEYRKNLTQYVDWNGHVSGFILPLGVLMPMRPAAVHHEFAVEYNLPKLNYSDAKKYYEKAAQEWKDVTMKPVEMILSENKKKVIGLLLQSEVPIPVKPIDVGKIKKADQLPEARFFTNEEMNRSLFEETEMPDSRAFMTARQSFLEETYERLRFELSRALGERPAIQQRIRQLIQQKDLTLREKKQTLVQILEPILEKYISREATKGVLDLTNYIPPNLRQRCSSLITPTMKPEKAVELCQETPHCRYDKPHKRCQLWIPNLEDAFTGESHQTTRQKMVSRLLEEFLRNPWKRDEVLEDRMEDLLNRRTVQLHNNEILLEGDGATLREQYLSLYRPKKAITSRFASPIWNTAQPLLTNLNRERYRIHLRNRSETIRTFLPKVIETPGTVQDILGKGYRMRTSGAESDQFFYALRGSAEEIITNNNNEGDNWVIWNSPENTSLMRNGAVPWSGDLDIWKKWYREHLEKIRESDIELFIQTIKAQTPKNKENPWIKPLEEGLKNIRQQNSESGEDTKAFLLLQLVLSVIFTPAQAKSLPSWSDVQRALDRGDYPVSDFDFFILHRILGFHVLLFERRPNQAHPNGYTWYRAGSLNAPVWAIYQYKPAVFLHVDVIELRDHLWLPIPTFMNQTQKWILGNFKEIPATDVWSEGKQQNPWSLTTSVNWESSTLKEWKNTLENKQ